MKPPPNRRLTHALPHSTGQYKTCPEDFQVEEIPAYEACGEGEHLFVQIEKTNLTTPEAANLLEKTANLPESSASWAGLKDKYAVCRQTLCLPAQAQEALLGFSNPDLRILSMQRHGNKLKTGHLKANRFRVMLRQLSHPDAAVLCFEQLLQTGFPNFFGQQRFGQDNFQRGFAWLKRERLARWNAFQKKIYLSTVQSELFNRLLNQRLQEGAFFSVLEGDVLKKYETGGEFVCRNASEDQARFEQFELSPTGPMYGPKMTFPEGETATKEAALLSELGLSIAHFKRLGPLAHGARRPLRALLKDASFKAAENHLELSFTLASGCYATSVIHELIDEAPP
ncbi:MAG: tRNA pseudouridine(13) synthase TruD [Proteobacteria bacterium]|nr:tRNA pseudouridine(13) synthase TruD [Cystobacterineae bacterium]MCL2259168.1 tRNA pseudouridine(13) synthase TruD [Cystobacterineae bacterium]MCL2314640.1 tRNA pseudouridine(13) synthase TruD [Pseudomonadota bacterium]